MKLLSIDPGKNQVKRVVSWNNVLQLQKVLELAGSFLSEEFNNGPTLGRAYNGA
jgi:hypothetical protein